MRGSLLLDTQILLWLRLSPEKLRPAERRALDSKTLRHVSAASLWEIAILLGLGRIRTPTSEDEAELLAVPRGFAFLGITTEHCWRYRTLPFRHRDPFDRMIVAQALAENMTLLARDRSVREYERDGLSLL